MRAANDNNTKRAVPHAESSSKSADAVSRGFESVPRRWNNEDQSSTAQTGPKTKASAKKGTSKQTKHANPSKTAKLPSKRRNRGRPPRFSCRVARCIGHEPEMKQKHTDRCSRPEQKPA